MTAKVYNETLSSFFLDLNKEFDGLKDNLGSFKKSLSGFKELDSDLKGIVGVAEKADKSIAAMGKSLGSLVGVGASLYAVFTNLDIAKEIFIEGKKAIREFSGVAEGLTFAKAISGSEELSENIADLEKTSDVFKKIGLAADAVFNTEYVVEWSGKAINAFAKVEQAAYRLSTVTVQGNEQSIDSIDKTIESMRELQKQTNFAVGSVALLNTQYDIASAGFTKQKDTNNVGKASINLSQAGFGNVGGSTNAIVRVLKSLDEGSDQAEKRAAQLFTTTKVGLLTLDQLTGEIGSLSVQAKSLGVDFEDVTAALAGLTLKGVTTSEASTKINALFNEIASGSEEANKYLANFRDSAGKPIQLNASSLKEKGLKGIIDDLKSATGGDTSVIQKLFSTKEAQDAVKLLISLGDDYGQFVDRIKNASTENLSSEAKNRAKTLVGAYEEGINKSQASIEDFGKGFKPDALQGLIQGNKLIEEFADKTATTTGETVGFLTSIATKAKAIGGFLLSATGILGFFAAFKGVGSVLGGVKDSLFGTKDKTNDDGSVTTGKKGLLTGFKKENETIWESVKRNASLAADNIENRFSEAIARIAAKVKELNAEVSQVGSNSEGEASSTPLTYSREDAYKAPYVDRSGRRSALEANSAITTAESVEEEAVKPKFTGKTFTEHLAGANTFFQGRESGIEKVIGEGANQKLGQGISTAARGFDMFKNSAFGLKTAFSAVLATGKEMLLMFAGSAAIIGIVGGAISYVTTVFSSLTQLLDHSTIPELQTMRDTLNDFKDVKGISDIVDDLDPLAGKVTGVNEALDQSIDIVNALGGAWKSVTGQTKVYGVIKDTINDAQGKLTSDIDENLSNSKKGVFGAKTDAGKIAEDKLNNGLDLSSEDKSALEAEQRHRIEEIDARIALQRQKIAAFDSKGDGNKEEGNQLKTDLTTLEKTSEEQKKQLGLQTKQLELKDAVRRLQSLDITIPLNIQLSTDREEAVKAQIKDVTDLFKDGINGVLDKPEAFNNLKNKLDTTFKGIQAEAELDPQSAVKLKEQLENSLGKDNLTKLYKANPELLQGASTTNAAITQGISKNAQNTLTSKTAVLDSASNLGSNSTAIALDKYQSNLTYINELATNLSKELADPATSLARQAEILAQIEELEAKRLSLNADAQIRAELDGRKQTLSVAQELLNLEQIKLGLYSQENKFDLFSMSLSQAKLDAAIKEVAVKKEGLEISSREDEIKKQAIITSLQDKVTRDKNNANTVSNLGDTNLSDKQQSNIKSIQDNTKKKIDSINQEYLSKKKISSDNAYTFDDNQKGADDKAAITDALINISRNSANPQNQKDLERILGKDKADKLNQATIPDKDTESLLFTGNKLNNGKEITNLINRNRLGENYDNPLTKLATGLNLYTPAGSVDNAGKILNDRDQSKLDSDIKAGQNRNKELNIANRNNDDAINKTNINFNKVNQNRDVANYNSDNIKGIIGNSNSSNINSNNINSSNNSKLTTAQQDASNSKFLNELKLFNADYEGAIKVSTLTIENEYAAREKSIKQGELLAQSLGKISGLTDIFGNSVAGAGLELINFQAAKPYERLNKDAEEARKQVGNAQNLREKAVTGLDKLLADAVNSGASKETIAKISDSRNTAIKQRDLGKSEAASDLNSINQNTAIGKVYTQLQEDTLSIKSKYAQREAFSNNSSEVANAYGSFSSGLGSVLNSISPNSSYAAKLNTQAVSAKASADIETRGISKDKQFDLLDERLKGLDQLIEVSKQTGVDPNKIKQLTTTRNDTVKEIGITKDLVNQRNSLQDANDKLSIFSAKLSESSTTIAEQIDILTKESSITKDSIDFQQRQRDLASASNKSGANLQSSFFSFLGKNSPITDILQQRLDVKGVDEDTKLAKAKNTTDAQKEILDLTLQKAQLSLEEQGYENALTQTALLGDVLGTLKGEKTNFSSSDLVQQSIANITQKIQQSRGLNAAKSDLIDQKLNYVPTELDTKNTNLDRDALAKKNNILGSNLLPANFDLIKDNVNGTKKALEDFNYNDYKSPSLSDPEYKAGLDKLKNQIHLVNPSDANSLNKLASSFNANGNANGTVSVQAPISITIPVNGTSSAASDENFQNDLKVFVGKQVNTSLDKLSQALLAAVSK